MSFRLTTQILKINSDRIAWTALEYLSAYRILVAALFAGLFFTPLMNDVTDLNDLQTARTVTMIFCLISPILFLLARRSNQAFGWQLIAGLIIDVWGVLTISQLLGGSASGFGTLLVGATLVTGASLPIRLGLLFSAALTLMVIWQSMYGVMTQGQSPALVAPSGILGAVYFATCLLGYYLARRARESQELALQRSAELANLTELNEKIIARMRTGIMIVDRFNTTHLMNESAWYLLGMPGRRHGKLEWLAPEILEELEHWRQTNQHRNQSYRLAAGVPDVTPRFAQLGSEEESDVLVFLEDASIVSRRAQEMTLSSLGRLSATIAHEIRNPLGAISHSAQLLAESDGLSEADRRLSDIITKHCSRMNEIIENVLQLARQQPPRQENIGLNGWLSYFLEEFKRTQELSLATINLEADNPDTQALVDPLQLYQIVWNLCQNALKYGRSEDGHAHLTLSYGYLQVNSGPYIRIEDRGAGIPPENQDSIFQPFFTSSVDGSGLGLYLCYQLCEANQAKLSYYDAPRGGAGFQIALAATRQPLEAEPEITQETQAIKP